MDSVVKKVKIQIYDFVEDVTSSSHAVFGINVGFDSKVKFQYTHLHLSNLHANDLFKKSILFKLNLDFIQSRKY